MSDTDYMPSNMESISEPLSGNESPVILGTPTTQQQRKSRTKRRLTQHNEQESALQSAKQDYERKRRKRDNSDSSRSPSPPPKEKRPYQNKCYMEPLSQKGHNDIL